MVYVLRATLCLETNQFLLSFHVVYAKSFKFRITTDSENGMCVCVCVFGSRVILAILKSAFNYVVM